MKLTYFRKIRIVFLTALFFLPGYSYASNNEAPQRFSFAISGGASKGAYEAGLNWALIKLISGLGKDRPALQGRYRPSEISSVAGASAGGINTLLAGMMYCSRDEKDGGLPNNIENNIFRTAWFMPDINDLLPPTPDSEIYRKDDAVLARKSMLAASEYLRELWNTPAFRKDCRVPLGITVTRVEPEVMYIGEVEVQNQRFSIPFEFKTHTDGTGKFSFKPRDYQFEDDYSIIILPTQDVHRDAFIKDEDILNAIQASSAFPVAFGRRQLDYCRIKTYYGDEETTGYDETTETSEDLKCPDGYELARAEFADGGLFDNLPLGLARKLAEQSVTGKYHPFPVSYIYIDPDRRRFAVPEQTQTSLCDQPNPPEACAQMEFGLASESQLLLGALGTARKYELQRELTSQTWSLNMSALINELADQLEREKPDYSCAQTFPYFKTSHSCHQALRYLTGLLELSTDRIEAPITRPFSVDKLKQAGLIKSCQQAKASGNVEIRAGCSLKANKIRTDIAQGMLDILSSGPVKNASLNRRIRLSSLTVRNDRVIRVTSRGAPVTGKLLNNFGAFLDLKFREYDYYVGIYDAVVVAAESLCELNFSRELQAKEFQQCTDLVGQGLYTKLELDKDSDGRYLFALLARQEFSKDEAMRFAYDPMPPEDEDMKILHEAMTNIIVSLNEESEGIKPNVETDFFVYLKEQGFKPTPTEDGSTPLLAHIMKDPDQWTFELTRRFTNRLDYLESKSRKIKAERDPDSKTSQGVGALVGPASLALRTATYKYPSFDFAPSTAPKHWVWRNVIPYELALDLHQADLLINWQPTWSLSRYNNLGIRGTIGLAEGLARSDDENARSNYVSLGVTYMRLTNSSLFSSWGITPAVTHNFRDPLVGDQDSFGGDVHVGMLKNRIKIGLGAKDFNEFSDSWYLTIGLTDLPGFAYWLSR